VPGFPETRASIDHKCDKWIFDDYREAGCVSLLPNPFGDRMHRIPYAQDLGSIALDCIVPGFPETADHYCDKWIFDAYRKAG
jgi:hypothetical protein